MNSRTKKKSFILLLSGLSVVALSQISAHFLKLTDLEKGLSMGVGIGLLLMAVFFLKTKSLKQISE
ncbi:hypothetical protein [Mesonia maritima]|uniref:Uncharacterized membrane protein (UPF0136 family) n=1 Tax=Mesonia maritima TaxID=1793873 RepID=A0ABU1K1G4_9FLAO|nr:hypothetical protein [Mesonia maritima]MDR6299468.1 uncharacterized membrane protein (UPF0136 family) [Mesonia maritima]